MIETFGYLLVKQCESNITKYFVRLFDRRTVIARYSTHLALRLMDSSASPENNERRLEALVLDLDNHSSDFRYFRYFQISLAIERIN